MPSELGVKPSRGKVGICLAGTVPFSVWYGIVSAGVIGL